MNWAFNHLAFMVMPVNSGNQWVMPAMMANTAPIDRT